MKNFNFKNFINNFKKINIKKEYWKNKYILFLIFLFFLSNILFFLLNFINFLKIQKRIVKSSESIIIKNDYLKEINKELELLFNIYHEQYENLNQIIIWNQENSEDFYKITSNKKYRGITYNFKNYLYIKNNKYIIEFLFILFYKDYINFLFTVLVILILLYSIYIKNLKKTLQLIEQRQADYYLLYQLFEPYRKIHLESNNVYVEYINLPYAKFQYKNHFFGIGGDYIFIKDIYLRKRKFIFFINADAMGKSLQGYTGIIILSSILSTILTRTTKRPLEQERYPETWLKYTSLEIHAVFETFQGFMMVSAIIGLIDEENGLFYFINFDHPRPIVCHSNQYFLLDSFIHKKLGFPRENEFYEIARFPLKEGDYLIIGSDGKDEVKINNQINEEETLSLYLLKQSNGDLQVYLKKLKEIAEIIDDLSLIKFYYQSYIQFPVIKEYNLLSQSNLTNYINNLLLNKEEIISNLNIEEYLRFIKSLLKSLLQKKKFEDIIKIFKTFVEEYPIDDELLFWYSYSCRKRKLYIQCAQLGERLLNFNRNHKRNILQLIYCYYKLNHQYRVKSLLQILIHMENNISKLNRIKKIINY